METKEINKQQMEAMEKLAKTNMDISLAKNTLNELKELEADYIKERELKTIERLNTVFEESQELLDKTNKNYLKIEDLIKTIFNFTTTLTELNKEAHSVVSLLKEKIELFDKKIEKEEKRISETKKMIEIQEKTIENEKKTIEKRQKELKEEERKLSSDRGVLERAIIRLKEERI